MKQLVCILLASFLFSCKKENIDGIVIGSDFLEYQSIAENRRLDSIIKKTLKGDHNSLRRLNHFPCNNGVICYDKGYVITQIIYKVGEENFIRMVKHLDQKETFGMEGYIDVGLEYGDNDHDGKMDNKKSKVEFPNLMKELAKK